MHRKNKLKKLVEHWQAVVNKIMSKKILAAIFRIFIGVILILFGIAGIILPVLQGVPFLLAGLIILSFDIPAIEHRLEYFVKKHHKIDSLYRALRKALKKKFNIS